jgi:hypothetical protein
MKRVPLVFMLGGPTSVLGSPRHARNVEWFEKYETQSWPAPSRFGFTGFDIVAGDSLGENCFLFS